MKEPTEDAKSLQPCALKFVPSINGSGEKLSRGDVKTIYEQLEKGHTSKELAHTKYGSDVNF